MTIRGFLEAVDATTVSGWCQDMTRPDAALDVHLLLDDRTIAVALADLPRPDLAEAAIGDGRHSFRIVLATPLDKPAQQRLSASAGSGEAARTLPRLKTPPELAEPPRAGLLARRLPRAILHIGTEKTGTTSLQAYLAVNRDRLLAQGVLVPRAGAPHAAMGILNHIGLATYALDVSNTAEPLRAAQGAVTPDQIRDHRRAIETALAAEITAAGPACHTLLLSAEHCQSRLFLGQEVVRLRNLLLALAETVEIIVYLRPQHEMAISLISTMLRNGETAAFNAFGRGSPLGAKPVSAAPQAAPLHAAGRFARDETAEAANWARLYYDHDALVARWEAGFGPEHVDVRLFDRDIVGDFMARLPPGPSPGRLDLSDFSSTQTRRNTGLGAVAQRSVLAVNNVLARLDPAEAELLRERLIEVLEKTQSGRGIMPARADAEAFQAHFAAGNERLRARHFPNRERLFDDDFAAYPEAAPANEASPTELAQTLVDILRASTA